jgi:hypothetical protein
VLISLSNIRELIMNITLRTKENGKQFISVENSTLLELKNSVDEIYQNSPEIKNLDLEPNVPYPSTFNLYGCRFVTISRIILYLLKNKYKVNYVPTIKELDDLADEGGMLKDAWMDGSKDKPIFNVLFVPELLKKIEKKFGYKLLQYTIIDNKSYTEEIKESLIQLLKDNTPFGVRLPQLYSKNINDLHFVNIDAVVYNDKECYLRMKETFKGYDGYDKFFIPWDYPNYYEIII